VLNTKTEPIREMNNINNNNDNNKPVSKYFVKDPSIELVLQGTKEESKKTYKNDYNILQEEITKLKSLISEYKAKNDKLTKDLKSFRNDNKKLYDHNKQINYNFNTKISLNEKEILYLKNLILKAISFVTCNNIKKYIDQILEAYSFISEYENERLKLERSFEKYEIELKTFIDKENNNNNNLENSELYAELKLKVSNAQNKVFESNRKIQDKKQEILILESKISKEKEKGNYLEKENETKNVNNNNNNLNGNEKKDMMRNPLLEKFSKMQKANLQANESKNKRNSKDDHNSKITLDDNDNLPNYVKRSETAELEAEDLNIDHNNFEKENSFEQHQHNEVDGIENNFFTRIENNTVNEFFNNNKATNVFKKNYVDSNKNAETEKNDNNNNNRNNEKKLIYGKNLNRKLNFDYKLDTNLNNRAAAAADTIQNNSDENSKGNNDSVLSVDKEINEESFNYNRNKQQSLNTKKLEGISIDTDKINEKYDKLLNIDVNEEAAKELNKHQSNNTCLLKDRNLEYKIKDQSRPFPAINSIIDNFSKGKNDKQDKNSEVPKDLDTVRNKHNLNCNYDIVNNGYGVENKVIDEEKANVISCNKNYNFDYKKSLNSERSKRDNKRSFKSILTDNIDKFGKSPEKNNSNKIIGPPVKATNDLIENPISHNNKDNYGCNNNFTFNNNEESENSIESKHSQKLIRNAANSNNNFGIKNDKKEIIGEVNTFENESNITNNVPKKRGFGRKNFDIDI